MPKFSKHFFGALSLIFVIFAGIQFIVIPNIYKDKMLGATAFVVQNLSTTSKRIEPHYNIRPSEYVPGVFTFNWDMVPPSLVKRGEAQFDIPIVPFNEEKAINYLIRQKVNPDIPSVRDRWGYPIQENAFMLGVKTESRKKASIFKEALAQEADSNIVGQYNCRANTSITGYFKAYFEDVALQTGEGFDHPTLGQGRRQAVCEVLQEMSELLMMDTTEVTPDILFTRSDQNIPSGALAAASTYFNQSSSLDNGTLHKHIISRQNPTPQAGFFDAFVITNWNVPWSVDVPSGQVSYDFHTVMWHEMMHNLGFMSRLPATVIQTGVLHNHNTFDSFIYEDSSLLSPFFNSLTDILNVPVGAAPSWFLSNQVVYRGTPNYTNATSDGTRPIYSPSSWQDGSSLSHFDMGRANGEVYVMHPSIGVNTERDIHDHELEVLCHLGYSVLGECEERTPWAENDVIALNNGSNPSCVKPLENDNSSTLRINSLQPIFTQSGDSFDEYYGINCAGPSTVTVNNNNTRSFRFTPTPNDLFTQRILKYTNKSFGMNRISLPAEIITMPDCELLPSTDPYEYICNGDFEFGYAPYNSQLSLLCPTTIIGWCNFNHSPDIFTRDTGFTRLWVLGGDMGPQDTYSGEPNNRYIGGIGHVDPNSGLALPTETVFNKTIDILPPGEYMLSWYGQYMNSPGGSSTVQIVVSDSEFEPVWGGVPTLSSTDIVYEVPINLTGGSASVPNWNQYQIQVTIPNNGINYQYVAIHPITIKSFLDGVSMRPLNVPPPPIYAGKITGTIYQDLNQSGSWNPQTESGLSGIPVSLYEQGNTTPIQTVTTESAPNAGKYTFSNLADGTYHIALNGESLYQNITEPILAPGVLLNASHVYTVNIANGQTISDRNFGVVLSGDEVVIVYGCTNSGASNYNPNATIDDGSCKFEEIHLRLQKFLHDSTLSLFDRNITWEIKLTNGGPDEASNINIQDVIPAGLQYHSYTTEGPAGQTFDPVTGIWNIPILPADGLATLYLTTKVPMKACGLHINTASYLSSDQTNTNLDTYAEASINVQNCINPVPGVVGPVRPGPGPGPVVDSASKSAIIRQTEGVDGAPVYYVEFEDGEVIGIDSTNPNFKEIVENLGEEILYNTKTGYITIAETDTKGSWIDTFFSNIVYPIYKLFLQVVDAVGGVR